MNHKLPTLVWLDLEMTGLNPQTCAIVQMAIILTNSELEQLAPPLELTIWQPESVLATMSPFVRNMHQKSGLLEKIKRSEITTEEAEQEALRYISPHAPYRTARLCGNTVYQDRRFLYAHMPSFEAYLHYRQIDVSTLKEIGGWWHDIKYNKPDAGKHTALCDIQQSLEEMRYYRKHLLRPQPAAKTPASPALPEA